MRRVEEEMRKRERMEEERRKHEAELAEQQQKQLELEQSERYNYTHMPTLATSNKRERVYFTLSG